MSAFGRVDYCRIGCDVSLNWDDSWWMRCFHRERVSTLHSIQNTVARRQLDGRAFGNDPDVFFLRTSHLQLSADQKYLLSSVNALLGSVLLISDDPGEYTPEQREQYRQVLSLRQAEEIRVLSDPAPTLQYRLNGKVYKLKLP
jgi:alpha-galactosidase